MVYSEAVQVKRHKHLFLWSDIVFYCIRWRVWKR